MTQGEVCNWLAAHPGWHETADIVTALGQGYKGVQVALSRAAMWRDIESRKARVGKGRRGRA